MNDLLLTTIVLVGATLAYWLGYGLWGAVVIIVIIAFRLWNHIRDVSRRDR